jgi:type III pantothenate kinase
LIVDIGNTRAKWAVCRGHRVESHAAARVGAVSESAGWSTALSGAARPDEVIVGCVGAPACLSALEAFTIANWSLRPRIMQSEAVFGRVTNGYRVPATLGIDRWAAIVAAARKVSGACCVVDAGSACTVDVVDPDGHHRGGWIVPGLAMQAELLSAKTEGVRSHTSVHTLGWGDNTAACVSNGSLAALTGMIELACAGIEKSWGAVACLLTGGDARRIASVLARPATVHDNLVIEGLDLLASPEGDSL